MFLTEQELVTLTGYILPACQIKWLKRKGNVFEVNKKGDPVVTRRAVEIKQGLKEEIISNFNFAGIK